MAKTIPPQTRLAAKRLADGGLSERAIARQLGISRSSVWSIKQAAQAASTRTETGATDG